MIQKKGLRPRGRPKEVPGDLKSVNIMVEIGRFKEFKEMCEELGVTTSEGIRHLIDKEIEQKNQVGPNATPIAVAYHRQNTSRRNERLQLDKRQMLLSSFVHFSDVNETFHYLKDANLSREDLTEIDRRYRNLGAALIQAKANVITR